MASVAVRAPRQTNGETWETYLSFAETSFVALLGVPYDSDSSRLKSPSYPDVPFQGRPCRFVVGQRAPATGSTLPSSAEFP